MWRTPVPNISQLSKLLGIYHPMVRGIRRSQPRKFILVSRETIANPALVVLDIEKFARLAHAHGCPLIVDNTFATPINCRPFEWGADRAKRRPISSVVSYLKVVL